MEHQGLSSALFKGLSPHSIESTNIKKMKLFDGLPALLH